jgi:hypothetical protein
MSKFCSLITAQCEWHNLAMIFQKYCCYWAKKKYCCYSVILISDPNFILLTLIAACRSQLTVD